MWLLPDQFRDPASEYEAVCNSAGIFDLANRAMLQFTGDDRLPTFKACSPTICGR
jgi:glycine cleavage system aminomethyltransferase T